MKPNNLMDCRIEGYETLFVRTRYWYDSFSDVWALVHLNGFPTIFVDEIDAQRKAVYILPTINGEFYHGSVDTHIDNLKNESVRKKKCILVWWNLERQSHSGLAHLENYLDAVWVGCRYYQYILNHPRCLYVPLGSDVQLNSFILKNHQELYEQRTVEMAFERVGAQRPRNQEYDFLHLSVLTHRRAQIIDHLPLSQPLCGHSLWGRERHEALLGSRFCLHLHQDELKMQACPKLALISAYALPLVCEHIPDSSPMIPGVHYLDMEYDRIPGEFPPLFQKDYGAFQAMGLRLWNLWTQRYPFQDNVRMGVRELLETPRCRLAESQWGNTGKPSPEGL